MAVALPTGENRRRLSHPLRFRQNGAVRVAPRQPGCDYIDDWFYLPYYLRQPGVERTVLRQDAQTLMVTTSVRSCHGGRVVRC